MPRYFFHIHDGQSSMDMDGTELANLRTARHEAVRFAGGVLRDESRSFWDSPDWRLEVTDAAGLILFALHVLGIEAPAAPLG